LIVISIASFAAGTNVDKKLLNDLSAALKTSTRVERTITENFTKAKFSFNGKTAAAFYDPTDDHLMGFSINLVGNDFPQSMADAVKKKYKDWSITSAILFVDADGNVNYFAQVEKNHRKIALKTTDGNVKFYSQVSYSQVEINYLFKFCPFNTAFQVVDLQKIM